MALETGSFKVSKSNRSTGEGSDEPRYHVTNLSKLEALAIQSALRLSRIELVKQVAASAAMETDEGRVIEDLAFIGSELARVCALEFDIGEVVEL
jgi:hypothetical protein